MKKELFETDCKYPFFIACKIKINGTKLCEIDIEDNGTLTYMPVPDDVKLTFPAITRFYKTENGQQIIENELIKREKALQEMNA